jgi:hypothetical protein
MVFNSIFHSAEKNTTEFMFRYLAWFETSSGLTNSLLVSASKTMVVFSAGK